MASARLRRREKQHDELARENARLHQDVEDLETAFFLHRQVIKEEENSVRGMIRKEVGGSRWQHGGIGKLTTYKSSKDLEDSVVHQLNGGLKSGRAASSAPLSQNGSSRDTDKHTHRKPANYDSNLAIRNEISTSLDANTKTLVNELYDEDNHLGIRDGDGGKILDLKTKVLKKASTKVIRRDTWHSPSRPSDTIGKVENLNVSSSPGKVSKDSRADSAVKRKQKSRAKSDSFKENKRSNKNIADINGKHLDVDDMRNGADIKINDKALGSRQSRKDMHIGGRKAFLKECDEPKYVNSHTDSGDNKTIGPKKATLNGKVAGDDVSFEVRNRQPEASEIYIDPITAEVRIRSLANGASNDSSKTEQTKVIIQGDVKASAEAPQSFKFSIMERDKSPPIGGEIRDVFGLLGSDTKSVLTHVVKKTISSLSPSALAKDCDTEVEFWLRGLGLKDVELYVKMFAKNEIDLLDLEFMSAAQLHDMGVEDSEALNVLLNGVRELRNLPPDMGTRKENTGFKRGLQAASIAWEETSSDKRKVKSVEQRQSGKKSGKIDSPEPSKNKTFTKVSIENLKLDDENRASSRNNSTMSNYNDYNLESLDSFRGSSQNQNSSTNAHPKASNKNLYSQYGNVSSRPASANSNKSPPNSKSQVQKKTACVPKKKGKLQDHASDSQSRLQALETRPARSVLLKRSASLTRETGRGQNRKAKDQEEIQNKKAAVKGRSRSAEAARRKALEGVQAAAKKSEKRLTRDRDNEEAKNKIQERKKVERDEMAARHLQREKNKTPVVTRRDTSKEVHSSPSSTDSPGLDGLITVNILSQPQKTETVGKSLEAEEDRGRTRVITPVSQTRKSVRRIEPAKKSSGKTNHFQSEYEVPLLSTYKLETRVKEGASSEPESGYKTDNSATYSQVEEKVADIQRKIKRLKSQALNGDEVTLTLVKDLQTELQHFEKLLTEKEKLNEKEKPEKHVEKPKEHQQNRLATRPSKSDIVLPIPQTSLPIPTLPRKSSPRQENAIEDLLIEDSVVKGDDDGLKDKAAMSLSKRELLDEMRKEKHQHHRQIRQLQSELKRMRETDAASTMELTQDDIVYREEDIIGEGAFSKVFRGTYQGAEVAVKRLVVPLTSQDRNYFAAEVSLLRELRHPRVVLLIGVCTTDKLPLMVLEYMSGGSLFNHLHDENSVPLDHAEYYQVARDIALGMNYLHSHKPEVLHLDLKSMNVLLCQSFRAKIADFGFSKLRHDSSARLAKKGKGHQQRGSPAWMSPELIDKGETTCKADVYSFAVVLWEMLSRQLPFENSSVFQVLEMVRKNKRPEIPPSCPEGLRLFISRCWDQNPAKRPHFKEVVSALENLAFPPAWRQLFKKAGVSEEALHNIESTRTLINLVKTTLDTKSFSSFMIRDPVEIKDSSGETTLDTSGDTTASTCILRKTTLNDTDDWENGTISDITEVPSGKNSEFSLGTLRGSSDESESDSLGETITGNFADDSSDYSSNEDSIVLPLSSERKSPHKKLNVFVPGLELSMKSPVAENSKDQKAQFDWMSISLEDRSYRDELNPSTDREVTSLNLSNRSNRIVAPLSPVAVSTARETEQKSWQEKAKEMDEYLMRESINNRRPSSPIRKRLSLTKKLAGKTTKSLDTEYNGRTVKDKRDEENEAFCDNRMAFTDRSSNSGLANTGDLASLNRKLADLNAKYENFDKRLTNLSQNNNQKLRKLVDEVFDSERLSISDGSHRSYIGNQSKIASNRSIKRTDLFNDKSYDSFYSLPVQNLPHETAAFRHSETTLPRCDSFTKSRDVLDLLTAQIGHTTKTLDEIENDSGSAKEDAVVHRHDGNLAFDDQFSLAKKVEQSTDDVSTNRAKTPISNDILTTIANKNSDVMRTARSSIINNSNGKSSDMNEIITGDTSKADEKKKSVSAVDSTEQDLKEYAGIRSVADHYRSRNVFPDKSLGEVDEGTKEVLRQKHLDDYREFVKTEILHDAGGSIENMKSTEYDKADKKQLESEHDQSQQTEETDSDESNKTVTQLDEEFVKDLSACISEKKQNDGNRTVIELANDKSENETEVNKIVNQSKKTGLEKTTGEEKESIRVVLNPSDIVGRKPIKTPRRSKMKEIQNFTFVNGTTASVDSKASTDFKKSESTVKSGSSDRVSKEDAVRQLDFKESQTDSIDITDACVESKHLRADESKLREKLSEDITPTTEIVTVDKVLKNCTSNNAVENSSNSEKSIRSQKAKLLPKQEQWKKLPEKPKTTAYVLKHPLSKGKRNSDEGNTITPASEMKTQQGNTVPKVNKDDYPEIPKKTIRVKLKKDPLAPVLSEGPPSPVPPAPPPPPIGSLSTSTVTFSKSVQVPKTAASMADELKLRVASWQSRSYQRNFLKPKYEPVVHKNVSHSLKHALSKGPLDSVVENQSVNLEDSLDDIEVFDVQNKPKRHKLLIPKLSEGVPDFAVQSLELQDQKDHLRSISKPHPGQLDDLSHVSQEQLVSIAELLRKAVMERRLALGEDSASVDQSMDSVSWSVETTPRP